MRKPTLPTFILLATVLACARPATAQEPNFGRAVEMTADELFIGQPVNWYGPGMVYAYASDGERWAERQLLTAPDSSRMDDFGRAIAVDGNTLVVGAPRKYEGAGRVYVFTRGSARDRKSKRAARERGKLGRGYLANKRATGGRLAG